ncbi:MAG: OprO/OprP family phosphate-selective porin [Verrucomicrobia bacterium]|nr:OprO/OprP family phosphate-selective porin [Verrucomicrobiota bacterium]
MGNIKIRTLGFGLLGSLALWVPPGVGSTGEIDQLRQQLAQITQRLEQLEREAAEKQVVVQAPAAGPSTSVVAGAGGFRVESADRAWSLRVRGNIHFDGRWYINDGGINNNDKFLLRRVRPSLEGTVQDYISFRVMPELATNNFALLDAWANFAFSPGFQVLVGKTKSPAGLERLVGQSNLLFIERGYPTQLLPNRDIGVQLHGAVLDRRLNWNVSVLAGARDGSNTAVPDVDDNFELAGRLFAHPFRNNSDHVLQGLGAGVSFTYGKQDNQSPAGYTTTGIQRLFGYRNGVVNDGTVFRYSPQGYWYFKNVGLLAEYAVSQNNLRLGNSHATITNRGGRS